jgi:hypothetical protein
MEVLRYYMESSIQATMYHHIIHSSERLCVSTSGIVPMCSTTLQTNGEGGL